MFASARDSANGLIHNARRNNSIYIDRWSVETITCPHTSRHTSQRRKLLAHKLPPTDNFCIRPAVVMMWGRARRGPPPPALSPRSFYQRFVPIIYESYISPTTPEGEQTKKTNS